ncbi:Flagellar transcriptional regulator FlhC [Paraburkholderia hiiakae]|uniref:Flagellar transcriptional regulator FlhC n=2 Tax=Paraburkholderia hiiakae TaxID=1081782 RepID=A0ABN7IGJ5_9BURK|nr:Flagellar transcriptional regulator FlhC [Paraburkholderia hiiakae]
MSAVVQRAAMKSLLDEAKQTQLAIRMIGYGARMQVLEAETTLSRDRLIRLYKELCGKSPSKGMLPYSADWFVTWRPNIHASLYYSFYRFLLDVAQEEHVDAFLSAYQLYLEHTSNSGEVVLTFTRAWTLLRFVERSVLGLCTCTQCGGQFVSHAYEPASNYVCGLCRPPSRAGKLNTTFGHAAQVAQPLGAADRGVLHAYEKARRLDRGAGLA